MKQKRLFLSIVLSIIIFSSVSVYAADAVNLGTAGNFAILSKSGVTDVPSSSIIGNVGTTPITGAAIGVSCTEVTGTIYDNNGFYTGGYDSNVLCRLTNAGLLNTARIDMEAAYVDAAGRTGGIPIGGNIGGMTLGPGVYTTASNLIIPADVILSGNSTDVWIFQIGGTLDISSTKKVILSGGAQASNVFWQVAGVTTLGTYSVFNGNILSGPGVAVDEAISLRTGATLCGRTLSQKAVTLDHNYISIICGNTNEVNTTNLTSLTVIKQVINNNGGTKNVSDFILLVDNYSVLSGISNVILPGTHDVSEIAVLGYSGTIAGDCSPNGAVTLMAGENKTCIITNDDVPLPTNPSRLTVNKIVINNGGGTAVVSDFILLVNNYSVLSGISNEVTSGLYIVSEVLDSRYNRSFSGGCSANGTVLLNANDVKTCVITNTYIRQQHKSIPVMSEKLFALLIVFILVLGLYGLKKYGK